MVIAVTDHTRLHMPLPLLLSRHLLQLGQFAGSIIGFSSYARVMEASALSVLRDTLAEARTASNVCRFRCVLACPSTC